jgi:SAM-dependent methyltransferase
LDGGCGTGNYIAAVKDKVGTMHGLDLNAGMLVQARNKFRRDTSVHVLQGSLDRLPYRDAMFDGMMCNQVMHHLSTGEGAEPCAQLRHLMAEAYRVLRPGGVLVCNTSSHRQLRDGFWWADLIPEAVNNIAQRLPTLDGLRSLLEAVGFCVGGIIVPVHEVLQGNKYLDPQGPRDKAYRDGDSTWSLTTEEELQNALARLQAMHDDGSIASYLQQREQRRHEIGQTTCVFARKEGVAVRCAAN